MWSKRPSKEEFEIFYKTHTNEESAKKFNVSTATIAHWATFFDIRKQDAQGFKIGKFRPSKEELDNFYKINGLNETAKEYDVERSTVLKWLSKYKINSRSNNRNNLPTTFNKMQEDIIIGSLLGDGTLIKCKKGTNQHSQFNEQHGEKQSDFLKWKFDILQPYSRKFSTKESFAVIRLKDPENGKTWKRDYTRKKISVDLCTVSHPIFTNLESKWYLRDSKGDYILRKNGQRIKIVPRDIILTPLAISVWYFDDGCISVRSRRFSIATLAFTKDDCEFLVNQLQLLGFEDSWVLVNKKSQPTVIIGPKSFLDFQKMLLENIPSECLKYKIDISKYTKPQKGETLSFAKLNNEKVIKIVERWNNGESQSSIAKDFSINRTNVAMIVGNKTWKHLNLYIDPSPIKSYVNPNLGRKIPKEIIEKQAIAIRKSKPQSISGYKGVRNNNNCSFGGSIYFNKKSYFTGSFSTPEEAAKNVDYWNIQVHGKENCYLNFPEFDYSNFTPKKQIELPTEPT